MSDLSIKAMQLAERMQGTEFENTSIQDLVIECALALESKNALISELVGALEPFANFGEYIHLETEGFSGGDEFELMIGNHLMERFKVTDFDKALSAITKAREQQK